ASLRRRRDGDQHGHDLVAAVDDLTPLVRADEAGVVDAQHGLPAVDDQRELAGEHEIDLLGRRNVRAGAAARQEVRQPDGELLWPARIEAEQTERVIITMVGGVIALRLGEPLVQHQNFSPRSMRYSPLGSTMATSRMMQPSPRSQFHGKNAKV